MSRLRWYKPTTCSRWHWRYRRTTLHEVLGLSNNFLWTKQIPHSLSTESWLASLAFRWLYCTEDLSLQMSSVFEAAGLRTAHSAALSGTADWLLGSLATMNQLQLLYNIECDYIHKNRVRKDSKGTSDDLLNGTKPKLAWTESVIQHRICEIWIKCFIVGKCKEVSGAFRNYRSIWREGLRKSTKILRKSRLTPADYNT